MEKEHKENIVIIGFGWVGQANALALVQMGYRVFYYDIVLPLRHYGAEYKKLYDQAEPIRHILEKDSEKTWYIVCVGDRVKEDGEQDITLIQEAIGGLAAARGRVILRSTVLPQNLQKLRFDYYLPEFLHEKHAVEECAYPFYFVGGKRNAATQDPPFILQWQLRARKVFWGTPEQASYIKYLSNVWNAVRIALVNEFGSAICEPKDHKDIQEIEKIVNFIFENRHYLRYGRAFGGHCLPKDLLAFSAAHAANGISPILKAVYISNEAHRTKELRYSHLPEWFSSWSDEYGLASDTSVRMFLWRKLNATSLVKWVRRRLRFIINAATALIPDRTTEQVRAIWNRKATENARYFVNTKRVRSRDVTEFDLRESGSYDYERYVAGDPALASVVHNVEKNCALEIGCGIGRMTEFFPRHFGEVYAIDISETMIAMAEKRLARVSNIQLSRCNGEALDFPDATFDFIFSYQTFQHIPTKNLLFQNVKEVCRVLKPGGIAKLHLRTGRGPYKWHWAYGASVTPIEAKSLTERAGFRFFKHQIEDTKGLWIYLEKPLHSIVV